MGDKIPSLFDPWVEWFEEWKKMMKENEDLERQSRENIVNFYRDELILILNGASPMKVLSDNVRSRLMEYGVLNKKHTGGYGKVYSVSSLGKKILKDWENKAEK